MSKHITGKLPDQTRLQSAMPKTLVQPGTFRTAGLHLRAVVVATYVHDEPQGANHTGKPTENKSVTCDLLTYGKYCRPIDRAQVMQSGGGIHTGSLWIPRPAGKTAAGKTATPLGFTKDRGSVPSQSDGDHVIVTFLEDNFQLPVVLGAIEHPNADIGNSERRAGHRIRPIKDDGEVRLVKNRGSYYGIDDAGNFEVNTVRAHDGELEADLSEPEPGLNGTEGNQTYKVPEGGKFEIVLTKGAQEGDGSDSEAEWTKVTIENNRVTISNEGGESILLENKDGATTLKIGNGAKHVAIVEALEAMWTAWQRQIGGWQIQGAAGATFMTIVGPAFQVMPIEAAAPAAEPAPWDSSINSSKVSLPDG